MIRSQSYQAAILTTTEEVGTVFSSVLEVESMALCIGWLVLRLLRIRFRAKGPRPIEAPGLGIVFSRRNLYIVPGPALFSCRASC
jgi:hypothetical protein